MRFGLMTLTLVVAGLALASAGPTHAQPGRHKHGGHGHGGADAGTEAHRRVEACLKEFDQVVADGRGFGLAFAADQNGYPGPLHALELKGELGLTATQEARMKTLFDAMLVEARAKAVGLAAAEERLRQVFADGTADAAGVRAAVAAAETARAELRLVHLLTHLEARDVLTEAQRRTYHQLRWGAAKNH
jgi:Spy/CpxP family protein refolding chaperone